MKDKGDVLYKLTSAKVGADLILELPNNNICAVRVMAVGRVET